MSSQKTTIQTQGTQLYYEEAGQGQAMIFVHAGIADHRMWDDQFAHFAQNYRVVRYDVRGYGHSDSPPVEYYGYEDLNAVLAQLGIARAIIIGCSNGGRIAIEFTLQYPEKVAALVLVGSGLRGHEWSEASDQQSDVIDAFYEARDFEQAVELDIQMWIDGVGRSREQVDPQVRERVREMILFSTSRFDQLSGGKEQRVEPYASTRLHEIQAPTLVIVGNHDVPDIVEIAATLTQNIPHAKQVVIEGTSHLPNMEQPARFNQIVSDFLQGLDR